MGTIIFEIVLMLLNAVFLFLNKGTDEDTKIVKCVNVIAIIALCVSIVLTPDSFSR